MVAPATVGGLCHAAERQARSAARWCQVEHAKEIIFWAVVAGVVIYDSHLFFPVAVPQLRFWPLPPSSSWRRLVMRVAGPLGPLSVVGILALGALDWNSFVWQHESRFALGGLLFALGGAFALWGFFGLGLGLTASQGPGGPLMFAAGQAAEHHVR